MQRVQRTRRQLLILAGITALTVLPQLAVHGTNVVTDTYAAAALKMLHGISPMGPTGADVFKYSPLFAALYIPLALLPSGLQACLWALINTLVFWAGIGRWFSFSRTTEKLYWVGLVLCAMELDGSLRYQQANALLVGMTLWALADYRDKKLRSAGFWLGLATNFKLLPGLFLLLLPWQAPYCLGLGFAGAASLAVPVALVGLGKTLIFHQQWYHLIVGDSVGVGLRDIATALASLGWPGIGKGVRDFVLAASLMLMLGASLRRKLVGQAGRSWPWSRVDFEAVRGVPTTAYSPYAEEAQRSNASKAAVNEVTTDPLGPPAECWEIWIALGLQCLVLVSPRTESPTFVLVAPCYLLMLREVVSTRRLSIVLYAVGAFLVTFSFNDLWPKLLWNPSTWHGVTKTFGVLLLWGVSAVFLCRQVISIKSAVSRGFRWRRIGQFSNKMLREG